MGVGGEKVLAFVSCKYDNYEVYLNPDTHISVR